jgi:hypothetical protein
VTLAQLYRVFSVAQQVNPRMRWYEVVDLVREWIRW